MKKLVAILLALCLMFSVAACSSDSEETKSPQQTEPQTAEDNTKSPEDNTKSPEADPEESETPEETKPAEGEITFDGLVAVDNEYCTITIKEIEDDNIWGYSLKAELENKSADKTYMFSVRDAAINGVQCDSLFASTVAPGKKSMEDISFSEGDLEADAPPSRAWRVRDASRDTLFLPKGFRTTIFQAHPCLF